MTTFCRTLYKFMTTQETSANKVIIILGSEFVWQLSFSLCRGINDCLHVQLQALREYAMGNPLGENTFVFTVIVDRSRKKVLKEQVS